MLSAKKESRRDAKAWEFDDKDRKGTTCRRYKQDDEETCNVESKVIVRLRMAGCACISAR
jgi:hypothetical protein